MLIAVQQRQPERTPDKTWKEKGKFQWWGEKDFFKEKQRFKESGYRPYKLVCAYVWIRK